MGEYLKNKPDAEKSCRLVVTSTLMIPPLLSAGVTHFAIVAITMVAGDVVDAKRQNVFAVETAKKCSAVKKITEPLVGP
jgi:hypothetical protein